MKTFKVYALVAKYSVLHCPACECTFRYGGHERAFGNVTKNARCQRCGKRFEVDAHTLGEDRLLDLWKDRERIVVRPSGETEFLNVGTEMSPITAEELFSSFEKKSQ